MNATHAVHNVSMNSFGVSRAWTSEMLARVTAPELAADVAGAEQLLARHAEIKTEIDARQEDFSNFYKTGELKDAAPKSIELM